MSQPEPTNSAGVVIVAAGSSTRMQGQDKLFASLDPEGNVPVLLHTVRAFAASPRIGPVVVVTNPANVERVRAVLESVLSERLHIVPGGERRQDSVASGLTVLNALSDDQRPAWVMIHDAARPFVTLAMIERGLDAAAQAPDSAAIAAVPVKDTIKIIASDGQTIVSTPSRASLYAAQTPQVFRLHDIVLAHAEAGLLGMAVTDDASLFERLSKLVVIFQGDYSNMKITTPDDLIMARAIYSANAENLENQEAESGSSESRAAERAPTVGQELENRAAGPAPAVPQVRIGEGYDAHRMAEGRKLMLGGVELPFERGLDGHSDADVLVHAVINALLGAAGLGDIGRHFPPSDPTFKGIASLAMLRHVYVLLDAAGWQIANVDATIVAQRPKIAPHIAAMRTNIATTLQIDKAQVNVKATTTERMGFVGQEEGMEARAVALLIHA